MSALLTFLTSRKTTLAAFVAGLVLLFYDAAFIATLHDLGISEAVTGKMVSAAKLSSMLLAALGYSPLKKPAPASPAPTEGA